ncbi:uncharacterized protein LOC100880813 isoform X1 [Megachile rotundata]|uniref:uncharacterized protein LOC100880813 isoform X1 n=1 Tax=Megachile rotundata TaxID=143995 RepID=UPI0006152AE7|nr:PREDICTED: uncharacterized protein LOC100880813 isoform X2 [Megachile rotundata]
MKDFILDYTHAYIHACERAELLGLPIPSEEEWKETQAETNSHVNDNDDDEVIQNLDSSDEAAQRIGGGLDELNSILNATQKKINRFKNVCGSLSTLLKVKVGSRNNTPDHKHIEQKDNEIKNVHAETSMDEENLTVELGNNKMDKTETNTTVPKKIDINEKMGSHLDKLDSLITKAENAQYSMQHQTKQMKKFLK